MIGSPVRNGVGMHRPAPHIAKRAMALFIALGLGLCVMLLGSPVRAASFSCESAKSFVEKSICSNSDLSSDDETLAQLYKSMRHKSHSTLESAMMLAEQRMFLDHRNRCLDAACLRSIYAQRTRELRNVILLADTGSSPGVPPSRVPPPFWYDCQFAGHGATHHWFVDLAPNQERLFASGNVYNLDDTTGSMSGADYQWSVSQSTTGGEMADLDVKAVTFTVAAATTVASSLHIDVDVVSAPHPDIHISAVCPLARAVPFAG